MSESKKEPTIELRAAAEIDSEYERLIAPLSMAEYEALKASIQENGLLVPIVVNEAGIIIDGHHRYRACAELDIQPRFLVRKFVDRAAEKAYAIEANLLRRHANNFVKCKIALTHLAPIEKERAHARRLAGLKNVGESLPKYLVDDLQSSRSRLPPQASRPETGEVLEILARRIGTSAETLRRARHLLQAAPAELVAKLETGEMTINAAFEQVRKSDFVDNGENNDNDDGNESDDSGRPQGLLCGRLKKPPMAILPAELFDHALKTIREAQGRGLDRVGIIMEKRRVTSVAVILDGESGGR